ncbi:SRPBCC family protein [Cryptosporangium aurantiacum]|uniref:Carbon monoxide dehydrogenase subunit G n=1 Tax=Cryptosporangium aurantiacum TaxID=134849 RepID=A0A1M7RK09_9ACTN|nr:SRPBCC family protein [Cryptosporangium aurantiacum]SHN46685.1 Carbon monoxide dehydrogenase subunit G [Cryptosporangium aurantiacum]
MDLTHRFHVPSDVDATWAHFQDVSGLAGCFPGASVTSVDGDEFTGSCKVKLGPIALVYNGSGTFSERDESAHRLVVEAKGRDKRGNGTAAATATLTMSEASAGGTDVEVVTDLTVTGKPAQFGRGLIQDVSDKLLGQFVGCLEQQLSPSEEAPAEPEPTPSPTVTAPPATPVAPPAQPEALDLGATVLPVVLRNYWKPALGGLVVVLVLLRLLRRRSR